MPGIKEKFLDNVGNVLASLTLPMLVHISKGPYAYREDPRNMGTLGSFVFCLRDKDFQHMHLTRHLIQVVWMTFLNESKQP